MLGGAFRVLCLALLTLQNSAKSILGFVSQRVEDGTYAYSVAVLCGEITKIAACVLYLACLDPQALRGFPTFACRKAPGLALRLAVPALAYFIQQNLEFLALYHLDAPTFQVLVQLKLISTAIFSVALLNTSLSRLQWMSLALLCIGVSITQMPCDDNSATSTSRGFVAALMLVTLSGFAAAYTEGVLKSPEVTQVPFCFMQILLALVSVALGGLPGLYADREAVLAHGPFHRFNYFTWINIVVSAAGGLLVAATLKYASAISKGYAISLSVVLTGVVSWMYLATPLSFFFVAGGAIVVLSILVYNEASDIQSSTNEDVLVDDKNCSV